MSATVYAVDAMEYRMLQSLKGTLKKLKRQKLNGLAEIERSHYLQGTFKQLCNAAQMKSLLYPGFSEEAIRQLPQNLVEILEWKELELDEQAYAKSGADVLKNIKLKGAKQGDFMDAETEEVLLPQIACEALAKGLMNAVQKQSRKISSMLAKTMKQVASISDDRATRDQLDMEVIDMLMSKRFAVQHDYLGEEWLGILQNDITRFFAKERLAYVDEAGSAVVPSDETGIELQSRFQRMCWLENDESIQERYPAISELVDQLHALPFELNGKFAVLLLCPLLFFILIYTAKCTTAGFQLLEASSGTTMFVYYPAGTAQILRLDSQVNKEGYDSGIR